MQADVPVRLHDRRCLRGRGDPSAQGPHRAHPGGAVRDAQALPLRGRSQSADALRRVDGLHSGNEGFSLFFVGKIIILNFF